MACPKDEKDAAAFDNGPPRPPIIATLDTAAKNPTAANVCLLLDVNKDDDDDENSVFCSFSLSNCVVSASLCSIRAAALVFMIS